MNISVDTRNEGIRLTVALVSSDGLYKRNNVNNSRSPYDVGFFDHFQPFITSLCLEVESR